MLKSFSFLLLVFASAATDYEPQNCTELSFLPMPQNVTCELKNKNNYVIEDPCRIFYHIKADKQSNDYSHFKELIDHQQLKTFHCHISNLVITNDLSTIALRGFKYTV